MYKILTRSGGLLGGQGNIPAALAGAVHRFLSETQHLV